MSDCERLTRAERWSEAQTACRAAWEQSQPLEAAAALTEIHARIDDPDGALAWAEWLRSTPLEADALSTVAMIHLERRELVAAEAVSRRELDLQRAAADHAGAARAAYRLFYLASVTGADRAQRTALDWAGVSYEEARLAGDRVAQARAGEALTRALWELGDASRSAAALRVTKSLIDPNDTAAKSRLLVFEGIQQVNGGRPAVGRRLYLEALELVGPDGDRALLRQIHLNLVKADLERGDVGAATGHLDHAADLLDDDAEEPAPLTYYRGRVALGAGDAEAAAAILAGLAGRELDSDLRQHVLLYLGHAEAERGRAEAAAEAFRESIAIVERLRVDLGATDLREWFLGWERDPYEALFALEAARGDARAALEISERARARALLDAMLTPPEEAASGELELDAALRRADGVDRLLPALYDSIPATPRTAPELLATLGERTALVYFEAEDALWLLAADRREVTVHRLAGSAEEIASAIRRFVSDLGDRELASELGELLLPAGARPAPGSELVVVPDGALGELPFAALRIDDRFLIERHTLVQAASLGAYGAPAPAARMQAAAALLLADPRGDLPAARREGTEVAARLGVTPRLGGEATLERVLGASHRPIIHLATHAGLDARGPWLELADGRLWGDTIATGPLQAELVVLASCGSAARDGRGLWGSLAAAFLAAGSAHVLATLGSVEDDAARTLVDLFYSALEPRVEEWSPARALALAQRRRIDAGVHPRHWATFTLFGTGTLLGTGTQFGSAAPLGAARAGDPKRRSTS